jgi:hypothetical protein
MGYERGVAGFKDGHLSSLCPALLTTLSHLSKVVNQDDNQPLSASAGVVTYSISGLLGRDRAPSAPK